ncbi:MAG TPA: hypothetical protein VJB90_01670 [Candidatus Nanoarchaeia archaeon]|nr:hypothetical protein [Candidatus Nanoarchaeia archaeon]
MVDPRELERLPPAERIRKLKQIEEDRKKEIKEAENLIRSSEREIEVAETVKRIPLPQMRSVDPSTLFSREEKAIFETHHQTRLKRGEERVATATPTLRPREEENLEETIASTPARREEGTAQFQYGKKLEEALHVAYKTLTEMNEKVGAKGYMSPGEQEAVNFYKDKLEQIHESLGHHPEDTGGIMGLMYGGLERISEMEHRMGYAHKGEAGHNPKYKI